MRQKNDNFASLEAQIPSISTHMSNFWKNYASTVALIAGILVGGTCGAVFGPAASVVKPVGDIFLNLLFSLVVPLVFFSISSSVCRLQSGGKVGKVLAWMVVVFLGMSVIAATLGYLACLVVNPLKGVDAAAILGSSSAVGEHLSSGIGQALVSSLSVNDFPLLFSKSNLLPLIIFSALVGVGTSLAGEKGRSFAALLESGTEVVIKVMNVIMYAAPIGLGCYFADTVASLGPQIIGGYLRVFVVYCVIALVLFFVINPAYILLCGGKQAFLNFWAHILPPSLTAIATCSSAAAMPGNIEAAKKMGLRPSIAEAVIPLGTNLHKDGTVMGEAIKVVFLLLLFGQGIASPASALQIIGIAVLAAAVMGAVPNGGMTGEILTCTLLGLDPSFAGVIIIIGTIIDIPATLLNSSSNVVAAILVDRFAGKE